MLSKIHSLFGSRQVPFRGTSKPITPFEGLISLVEFFGKIRLTDAIQDFMPFKLSSPNAIPPAHTLMAFFFSAIVGASRFAHTDWLRADKALHAMLGIPRFPSTDTIRNLFSRFTQGAIEASWRPFGAGSCPTLPHLTRALVSTLIRPSSSAASTSASKAPRKVTTRNAQGVKAITPCWPSRAKPSGFFMPGCGLATPVPVGESPIFFAKPSPF
jgi:hypothetical protein